MPETTDALITGISKRLVLRRINARILILAAREFRSVSKISKVLRELYRMKRQFAGGQQFTKLVRSGRKYHWQMHIPGYPSVAFDNNILGAFNRFIPVHSFHNQLTILFLGITKKCPLNCSHCYAWDDLNRDGAMPLSELKEIISVFQQRGLSQLHFCGGEPMTRFEDLLELIRSTKPCTETWIATSGYGIDREKSDALKKAGLTGVAISLDHYDPKKHNEFRGSSRAYEWAVTATQNCIDSGLLTCWSLCATGDFISQENLMAYAESAASSGVNFIQLLEPMASGHYSGQDVRLDDREIGMLEDFYLRVNHDSRYKHFPIAVYPSYHQRRMGCLAAGNRYLYIDPDGCLHPCPFCHSSKELRIFSQDIDTLIAQTQKESCLFIEG
jgi:MoaA/NifB/PqqE/SkfB family radical SAM enzyme